MIRYNYLKARHLWQSSSLMTICIECTCAKTITHFSKENVHIHSNNSINDCFRHFIDALQYVLHLSLMFLSLLVMITASSNRTLSRYFSQEIFFNRSNASSSGVFEGHGSIIHSRVFVPI